MKSRRLRLNGIPLDKNYRLEGTDEIYGGDELTFEGILIPELRGDFQSIMMHFIISK